MSATIVKFQDTVYAKSSIGILVWDDGFQNFRPCEQVVWNPVKKCIEAFYGLYTSEIFDRDYGYGEHRNFCVDFTDKNADKIQNAEIINNPDDFWKWTGQKLKWTGDRGITLHPCFEKMDKQEYLRILQLRRRTYKHLSRQIRKTRKNFQNV